MTSIRRVAVIGMGALGACYARQILQGDPSTRLFAFVRDPALRRQEPILLNGEPLKVDYRSLARFDDGPVDLILVAVKSYDLEAVIRDMAPLVGPDTVILSLLNGMLSEEQLGRAFGKEHVLFSTVMGADSNREGRNVHCQSPGVILFGAPDGQPCMASRRLEEFAGRCGLSARWSEDIMTQMWFKLLVNIGFNQVSTAYQLTYGQFREDPQAMETMRSAQREVCALAQRCGIELGEEAIHRWEDVLSGLSPDGRSSMLQDYWTGRRMETDILGDYVTQLGRKLDVPTPINDWLNARVKQMGRERDEARQAPPSEERLPRAEKSPLSTPKQIAGRIRIDIVKQKYKAGDKLAEKQLADQYAASRSSVRTALQILSGEGLIITHPNGRREVAEFSERQVKNLYDFRWLIENRALELTLQKSSSIFPKLAEILSVIEDCCSLPVEDVDWYDLDVRFHRALVASAEDIFLSNAWESNAEIFYTLMNFNTLTGYSERYATEFFEKHRRIYEFLLSRDRMCLAELKVHILDAENIANSVLNCFGSSR